MGWHGRCRWGVVLPFLLLIARAHADAPAATRVEAGAAPASTALQEQRAARVIEAFAPAPPIEPSETLPASPEPLEIEPKRLWDIVKVLPIVIYTPETSVGLGAGALFLFDMPGAVAERRPSSVSLGGIYTFKHQILSQLTPQLRFGDDDWVVSMDLLGVRFPNRFHGIGNDTKRNVYDTFTDAYLRGSFDVRTRPFPREHPFAPLYVGAHYRAFWTDLRDAGNEQGLFGALDDPGEQEQFVSGVGPVLAWDSRDGLNWPLGGSFIELRATFNEPVFGGTLRSQALVFDARRYQRLWFDHILALRAVTQSVWGEVPLQQLPMLGGSSLLRGFFQGQLRDRQLLALEAEYRLPIRKRWAVVAFGSVGEVAPRASAYSWQALRAAGGGGLRFAVDAHDRTNIRLDFAYGDHFYPYIQFREAF